MHKDFFHINQQVHPIFIMKIKAQNETILLSRHRTSISSKNTHAFIQSSHEMRTCHQHVTTMHVLHNKKWCSIWAACGSFLSILPMPHECYEREIHNECANDNLKNIAHLFDGNNIAVKKIRHNNS